MGSGRGAVEAEDGGAVVGEEEACEGAWGGWISLIPCTALDEFVIPGANPANSRTRMPLRGGGWCCVGAIAKDARDQIQVWSKSGSRYKQPDRLSSMDMFNVDIVGEVGW